MYAKSTRPSAKREIQKELSAKRDDQIARDENVPTKRADCLSLGYNIIFIKNISWSQFPVFFFLCMVAN